MKLKELAERIGAELVGDGQIEVGSVNTLEDAGPGQVSFLANRKYAKQLETTRASAVIVHKALKCERVALLRCADAYYAHCQALVILHGYRKHPHAGVHPAAHIDPSATIGEGTVVYPGAYIGPRVRIGKDCIIYANASIYDECVLGDRVILHSGAVIGVDGFGYATHGGVHHKVPQIGNVVLEDDVEIGANSCVARAALGSTTVGKGTKMDALSMVGHNVKVGEHGMIVAQVGIAGSTQLGHHVTLAGQVGIAGHLKIGNQVTIGAQTGVIGDLSDNAIVVGSPAMPALHAKRVYAIFTQLPELQERIRTLEDRVGVEPPKTQTETA